MYGLNQWRERIMKPNDRDTMRDLFAELPDEPMPLHLNEKVMSKVLQETFARAKRNKRWEIFAYISGGVAMMTVCVLILASMGVDFKMPSFNLPSFEFPFFDLSILKQPFQSFPKPDFSIFKSSSFLGSLYIGLLVLFLLISDSLIRRRIARHKK